MPVTIVKGRSKTEGYCWCKEGWVISLAKRKLKEGKVMCRAGRIIVNKTFNNASDALKYCVTVMKIPEYKIVLGNDVYKDIEKTKKEALAKVLKEKRINELADQFLPPTPDLNSLKLMFPGVQEQTLNKTVSRIKEQESFYKRATGVALYELEEDIKRITEENNNK